MVCCIAIEMQVSRRPGHRSFPNHHVRSRRESPSRQSLVERVWHRLIVLHPTRDKPVTEDALASHSGVSRTSIRHALQEIEADFLIERRKKAGIWLREFTPDEVAQLFDLRALLEAYAAALAARRAQPADIEELRQIKATYDRALASQDLIAVHEEDLAFHRKIIDLAGNPFLTRSLRAAHLLRQVFRLRLPGVDYEQVMTSNAQESSDPHELIIDALERRDPDECAQVVRTQVLRSKIGHLEQMLGVSLRHDELHA